MNSLKFTALLALFFLTEVGHADPLDTWTWRNPLPTGSDLYGIAYGDGQFVAVGYSGVILTSTDGATWIQRRMGNSDLHNLNGIAYGNGQFVAVGEHGAFVTSSDGVNWVERQSGQVNHLYAITYGQGQFVAVGRQYNEAKAQDETAIFTSADGLNWVQRDAPTANENEITLHAIAYGNGLFVAGGGGYNSDAAQYESALLTSVDGVNWVQRPVGTRDALNGVTYGNGQFVVVGYDPESGSPTILASGDGVSWVERQATTLSGGVAEICFGNGQFVAVGFSSVALTSTDGVTWTGHQLGTTDNNYTRAVAYGVGQFVGVGDHGIIVTSADGANWVVHRSGTQNGLASVAYGNGRFVAVGDHGTALITADGVNWVQRQVSVPQDTDLRGVAYGSGQFVAVGEQGAIVTTTDGVNWVQRPSGTLNYLRAVAYGNGQFAAVGEQGAIVTTTDGVNWVQRPSGTQNTLNGIAYGNGQFVAVGGQNLDDNRPLPMTESTIVTSADGINWFLRHAGTQEDILSSVAFGNGQFVAVGSFLTSSDGLNLSPLAWEQTEYRGNTAADTYTGIAYGNGEFVVTGNSSVQTPTPDSASTLLQIPAGSVDWLGHSSGTKNFLSGIAFGNGRFVAVGASGTILESGPVINLSLTPNAKTGSLSLSLEGPPGLNYTIESSDDLVSWRDVTTITNAQPGKVILDGLPAAAPGHQFYRATAQ